MWYVIENKNLGDGSHLFQNTVWDGRIIKIGCVVVAVWFISSRTSWSNCWELDSLPGPLILTWYKKNDSRQNAYSINSWYTVYAGDVHSTKAICRSEGQSLDLLHLYCFQTSSVSICLSYVVSTLCCLPHYSCTVSIRTPPYTVICLNFIFYFPAHALTYYLCGWPLHELSMHLKLHCLVLLCNLRWVISLSILIQMC